MPTTLLHDLLELVRADERVCPHPQRWHELWKMLPNRKRLGRGWDPPLPLVLGHGGRPHAKQSDHVVLDRAWVARNKDNANHPLRQSKGGVAKTTNAVAVAERLACDGFSVLVLDADHQCTAGDLLLGERRLLDAERRQTTLHDLLRVMLDDDFDTAQFSKLYTSLCGEIMARAGVSRRPGTV